MLLDSSETLGKTYQLAEKIYPGMSNMVLNRKGLYDRFIQDLSTKIKDLNSLTSCLSFPRANIIMGAVGVAVGVASIPLFYYKYMGYGLSLMSLGTMLFGMSFTMLLIIQRENERESRVFKVEKSLFENRIKLLEAWVEFAENTGVLLEAYNAFKQDPKEDKVKPMIAMLSKLLQNHAKCSKLVSTLVDSKGADSPFYTLSKNMGAESLVFGNMAYLYLLDSICRELKEGPLVQAWNRLISLPVQELSQKIKKDPLWMFVGLQYPGEPEDIISYFKTMPKLVHENYAQALYRNLKMIMIQFESISG